MIIHYSKGSQSVGGEPGLRPVQGRAVKHQATLHLAGPAKVSFLHQGQLWHRRFGQLLAVDWLRLSDGNRYLNRQRPYESVPGWQSPVKTSDRPSLDSQQRGWDDQLLTPLIQHFRPFNSRLCPFEKPHEWSVKQAKSIEGQTCFLLSRKEPTKQIAMKDYHYWVCPDLQMSVVRLQRLSNGWIETQFDIQYADGDVGPEPTSYRMKRIYKERLLEFAKVEVKKMEINQPIADGVFRIPAELESE
jgi:hypothetical protein